VFVVGYGLDFQERFRNVPDILAVQDVAALAAEPDLLAPYLARGAPPPPPSDPPEDAEA
jgi:hypothetical protein